MGFGSSLGLEDKHTSLKKCGMEMEVPLCAGLNMNRVNADRISKRCIPMTWMSVKALSNTPVTTMWRIVTCHSGIR